MERQSSKNIPVLTGPKNFFDWRNSIRFEIMEKFGDLFYLLEKTKPGRGDEGRDVEVPVTVEDIFPPPTPGGTAAERAMASEELREVAKLRTEARANIAKVLGFLMNSLGPPIDMKVRANPRFEAIVETKDLPGLWRLIRDCVLGGNTASESQGALARQRFSRISQGKLSLEQYIDNLTKTSQLVSVHGVHLSEKDKVYQFVLNLNPSVYGDLIADWVSRQVVPETFETAITRVTEWSRAKASISSSGAGGAAVTEPDVPASVFVSGQNKPRCTNCRKRGHVAKDCRAKRDITPPDETSTYAPSTISKPKPRPAW